MGRPRIHDERTAVALLTAAEQVAAEGGEQALSVRAVAERAGTTTRAVYSLFGSRDGLLTALGAKAFDLLGEGVAAWPRTRSPRRDLVAIATGVFREQLIVQHPVLFELGVQRLGPGSASFEGVRSAADRAWPHLIARFVRLGIQEDRLPLAAMSYHSLCEGLGAVELRGGLPPNVGAELWDHSFEALLRGLGS